MAQEYKLPYSYGTTSSYKTFKTNGGYTVRCYWRAEEISYDEAGATIRFTLGLYYSSSTALWSGQNDLYFSVAAHDVDTKAQIAHSGNVAMPSLPAKSSYTTYTATLTVPRRSDGTLRFIPKLWCTNKTSSYLPQQSSFISALTWNIDWLGGTTVSLLPTVYLGDRKVKEVYYGGRKVKEIYRGNRKVK